MSQFGYAIGQLSAAQKSAKGVSLYSRYVNRPAGRVLAAAGYTLKLTPNQVTMISAVFTFAGVVMIATLRPSPAVAAGIFAALVLGFALDSADGQLARLTGNGSAAGEWLDHVVDCAKMLALHMAVLLSFYRHFGFSDPRYLLIPVAFQFAAVMVFFGGILTEQLKRADRLKGGATSVRGTGIHAALRRAASRRLRGVLRDIPGVRQPRGVHGAVLRPVRRPCPLHGGLPGQVVPRIVRPRPLTGRGRTIHQGERPGQGAGPPQRVTPNSRARRAPCATRSWRCARCRGNRSHRPRPSRNPVRACRPCSFPASRRP